MICGENIKLALFNGKEDLDEYIKQYMNIENRSEFDHTEIKSTIDVMRIFNENGLWSSAMGALAIKTLDSQLIGTVSYKMRSEYDLLVGYRIFQEEYRGRGLGTEALSLFTRYLFNSKRIERITLEIAEENIPSIRIAEKCGYKKEGLLRNAYYYRGSFTNFIVYGILRSEIPKF